jgi:hypothetical protein
MRMIYVVIDRMIACIPLEEQQNYAALTYQLTQVRNETLYKAPEQMPPYFRQVSEILEEHLGAPDTEWKVKIANIFGDKI